MARRGEQRIVQLHARMVDVVGRGDAAEGRGPQGAVVLVVVRHAALGEREGGRVDEVLAEREHLRVAAGDRVTDAVLLRAALAAHIVVRVLQPRGALGD